LNDEKKNSAIIKNIQGLPSTFLGRYGWIQYYCKCALREPSGLIHKNHQVFIVMNPIDLNLEEPSK
jgi:hypothetical protein